MTDSVPNLFDVDSDAPGLTETEHSWQVTENLETYDGDPLVNTFTQTGRMRIMDSMDVMAAYANVQYTPSEESSPRYLA